MGEQAQDICCQSFECAGIDFQSTEGRLGSGYFKADQECNKTTKTGHTGFTKMSSNLTNSTDITLDFVEVGFTHDEDVAVYDIWLQRHVGTYKRFYTARSVPLHGSA